VRITSLHYNCEQNLLASLTETITKHEAETVIRQSSLREQLLSADCKLRASMRGKILSWPGWGFNFQLNVHANQ